MGVLVVFNPSCGGADVPITRPESGSRFTSYRTPVTIIPPLRKIGALVTTLVEPTGTVGTKVLAPNEVGTEEGLKEVPTSETRIHTKEAGTTSGATIMVAPQTSVMLAGAHETAKKRKGGATRMNVGLGIGAALIGRAQGAGLVNVEAGPGVTRALSTIQDAVIVRTLPNVKTMATVVGSTMPVRTTSTTRLMATATTSRRT